MRPANLVTRYAGALSGVLAVITFLTLPVVQVSLFGMSSADTGARLIQSAFESGDEYAVFIGVALVLALLAAGLGSLLFLGDRYKHGTLAGRIALAILVALSSYVAIKAESADFFAFGLWVCILLLGIMSIIALLLSLASKDLAIVDDRDGSSTNLASERLSRHFILIVTTMAVTCLVAMSIGYFLFGSVGLVLFGVIAGVVGFLIGGRMLRQSI